MGNTCSCDQRHVNVESECTDEEGLERSQRRERSKRRRSGRVSYSTLVSSRSGVVELPAGLSNPLKTRLSTKSQASPEKNPNPNSNPNSNPNPNSNANSNPNRNRNPNRHGDADSSDVDFFVHPEFSSTAACIRGYSALFHTDRSRDKSIDLIRRFLNPSQRGHGIDVRCWAKSQDESTRVVEAFEQLLPALHAAIEHPESFALSAGLLQALAGLLLMMNSSLRFIGKDAQVKAATALMWAGCIRRLTRLVGRSIRLKNTKECSSSVLIYQATALEILLLSMPDPEMLGKSMKVGGRILHGLVDSVMSRSLDPKLISGLVSAANLGAAQIRRAITARTGAIVIKIAGTTAAMRDLVNEGQFSLRRAVRLMVEAQEACFTEEEPHPRWEVLSAFAWLLADTLLLLSGSRMLHRRFKGATERDCECLVRDIFETPGHLQGEFFLRIAPGEDGEEEFAPNPKPTSTPTPNSTAAKGIGSVLAPAPKDAVVLVVPKEAVVVVVVPREAVLACREIEAFRLFLWSGERVGLGVGLDNEEKEGYQEEEDEVSTPLKYPLSLLLEYRDIKSLSDVTVRCFAARIARWGEALVTMITNGGDSDETETWVQAGIDIFWSEMEVLLHEFEQAVSLPLREMLQQSVSAIQKELSVVNHMESLLQRDPPASQAHLRKATHELNTRRKEVGGMIVTWGSAAKDLLQVLGAFEAALQQTQSLLHSAVKMLQLLSPGRGRGRGSVTQRPSEEAIYFVQQQALLYLDRFKEHLLSISPSLKQEGTSHLMEVPRRMARYLGDLSMAISLLPPDVLKKALNRLKQRCSGESSGCCVLEMLMGDASSKRGLFRALSQFEREATKLVIQFNANTVSSSDLDLDPDSSISISDVDTTSGMDVVLRRIKALPIALDDDNVVTFEVLAKTCVQELEALVAELAASLKPEEGQCKTSNSRIAESEFAKVNKYLEVISSLSKILQSGIVEAIKTLEQGNRYGTSLLNKLKPPIKVSTLVFNTKLAATSMVITGGSAGKVSDGDIDFIRTYMKTMERLIDNNDKGVTDLFQVLTNRKFDIKLKSFCIFNNELKKKLNGFQSLVFTVKEAAVESLSNFVTNLGKSSGAGAVMNSVESLGLDGMVTALGGIASDAVNSLLAKQQFPRVREVSAFCVMRLLASMEKGEVKDLVRRKVAERRTFESEVRVRSIMGTGDGNSHAYAVNVMLCPEVPFQTSEEKQAVEEEAERKAWVRQEQTVYAEFMGRLASLEAGREAAEAESDPLKKQELLACCSVEQQALKQAALRVNDMSKKLNVIVSYLADVQGQLSSMDKKLDRLQADVTDIRNDLKRLIRKPPLEVIGAWTSRFMSELAYTLPKVVYIEAEVCGPGEKKNFKVDDKNKAIKVTEAFRRFMVEDPTLGAAGTNSDSSVVPPVDEETTETDEVAAAPAEPPLTDGPPPSSKVSMRSTSLTKGIVQKNVMLLSGLAGSGKSTAVQKIKQYLLDEYSQQRAQAGKTVVLITVSLPALTDPLGGVFEEGAKLAFGLSADQLQELKEDIQREGSCIEVVFILDAYDELRPDFSFKNLWRSNNLEQYRDQTKKPANQPKVFVTCRAEYLLEKGGSYLEVFVPMENGSTGTHKDSLAIASTYFEEVRFIPFSAKREAFQRQYVAIQWRDAFVARFESNCDAECALRDTATTDLPAVTGFVQSGMAADAADALAQVSALYFVSTYEDSTAASGAGRVGVVQEGETMMTRATSNYRKLDKECSSVGKSLPVFMAALLCATNGIDLSDSSILKLVGEFLKEKLLVDSELWLLDKYNERFKAMPELEELSGTPFMVQVVTEILPLLKVQGSSRSEIKSSLILLFGDSIGDAVWALMQNKYSKEMENLVALQEKTDDINKLARDISVDVRELVVKGKIKLDLFPASLHECDNDSDRLLSQFQRGVQVVLSRKPTRRRQLYDLFTALYLTRGSRKALTSRHGSYTYNTIMTESEAYCTNLALFMTQHGKTKLAKGTRSVLFAVKRPIDAFFDEDELTTHARNAAPVNYSGSFLTFTHKTIQEYYVAEAILSDVMRIAGECTLTASELDQVFLVQGEQQAATVSRRRGSSLIKGRNATNTGQDASDDRLLPPSSVQHQKTLSKGELRRATEAVESLVLELQSSSLGNVVLSEESAVIDFLLDSLLARATVGEYYGTIFNILVKHAAAVNRRGLESNTIPYADQSFIMQQVDTSVLFENLYAIASKKIPRRQDRMLLHEAVAEGLQPLAALALDIMKHSVSLMATAGEVSADKFMILAVNTQDANGKTPLYIAAECGNEEMSQLLLEHGADEHVSADAEFFLVQLTKLQYYDIRRNEYYRSEPLIDTQRHTVETKEFPKNWDAGRGDKYVLGAPALCEYTDKNSCYMYEVEVKEARTINHNLLLGWATTTIAAVSRGSGDSSKIEHVGWAARSAGLHTENHTCYIRGSTETERKEVPLQECGGTIYCDAYVAGGYTSYFEVPDGSWNNVDWKSSVLDLDSHEDLPKNFVLENEVGQHNNGVGTPSTVYGVAIDWNNKCLHFAINGQWRCIASEHCTGLFEQQDGDESLRVFPAMSCENGTVSMQFNFGDREFRYPPPLQHSLIKKCLPVYKANAGKLPLLVAVMNSHFQVVDLLLDRSIIIDPAMNSIASLRNLSTGGSLLHYIVKSNNARSLKKLLSITVDLNMQDNDGATALILASEDGHKDTVVALLEAKSEVNTQNNKEYTALLTASAKGYTDIVVALLEAKADMNMQDRYGATALIKASDSGHKATVVALVEAKADLNMQNSNGATALMRASIRGHKGIVVALLEAKAEVNMRNNKESTALIMASGKGYKGIVLALVEAKAEVNMQDSDGTTALMNASAKGYKSIVVALLEAKAEVNMQTNDGTTALMNASEHDHEEIVQLLKDAAGGAIC